MTTKICPVCGLEQDREASECTRCGWDFSPLLGTPEQVEALLKERLDRARTVWRQRRYNPELVPNLERDPFETQGDFASRVAERPWYVGEGELRKAEYDIDTGRFPLDLIKIHAWAKPISEQLKHMYLRQSRNEASKLYAQSAVWPVYARLVVRNGQVNLQGLELLKSGDTLPVFMEALDEPMRFQLNHWLDIFLQKKKPEIKDKESMLKVVSTVLSSLIFILISIFMIGSLGFIGLIIYVVLCLVLCGIIYEWIDELFKKLIK